MLATPERLGDTLMLNEDTKKGDFYIKGVTEESVTSFEEILEWLKLGEDNRHYAQTAMNHSSSRSHTIFRLMVQTISNSFIHEYRLQKGLLGSSLSNKELKSHMEADSGSKRPLDGIGTVVTESLLNFVDLAGSERVSNHNQVVEEGNEPGIRTNLNWSLT